MFIDLINNYKFFIIPLVAFIFAQLIKIIISIWQRNCHWQDISRYGGMPSAHASLVTSLVTESWLVEGIESISFAICVVLAVIVLRDALGLRRYVGEHGRIINYIMKDKKIDKKNWSNLPEKVGHTWLQIGFGMIIGFFITLILYKILFPL